MGVSSISMRKANWVSPMDLSLISHNIDLTKQDNHKWLEYARALSQGEKVSRDAIPAYKDTCRPCQWLYEHSDEVDLMYQKIDKAEIELFHFDIIEQIEILRYELHHRYLHLFKLCFFDFNNFFLVTLFRHQRPMSESSKDEVRHYFHEMQEIADELERKLDYLERSLLHLCRLNIA